MVFALRAIPFVVACKGFFLAKTREAIIKVNITAILHPLWYSVLLFLAARGSRCIQVDLEELRVLKLFEVNSGPSFPVDC